MLSMGPGELSQSDKLKREELSRSDCITMWTTKTLYNADLKI